MANQTLKFRRGTSYRLSFPTLPSFKAVPKYVDVYQNMYEHDIVVAQFPKPSDSWFKTLKTGVPVSFVWKQGRFSRTFLGYVYAISKKDIAGQKLKVMEVTFIGSSFRLKAKSAQVFKNKTIPEVAQWIAKKHKLKFVGDNDSRRFPHLSISGQSYWEWLHVNAQRIGFAMYVDGTTLVFKAIDKLIDQTANNAATFSMFGSVIGMGGQLLDRTLDSLNVTNGDYVETSEATRTTKVVGGVDPITSAVVSSSVAPNTVGTNLRMDSSSVLFTEPQVDRVVNSASSAFDSAKGAAQLARFSLPATAVGQGDPRVRPFLPVLINGTGEVTDGYWVVKKVHHILHRGGEYQVEMELATDGVGENAYSPFRAGERAMPGVVNTTDSLLDKIDPTVNSSSGSALSGQLVPYVETDQGFGRNPIYWEVSYGGKNGCCP